MELPPDVKFGLALAILGVVMLTLPPGASLWLGVLLVLAAVTYAEKDARQGGRSFIGDLLSLIGLGGKKP